MPLFERRLRIAVLTRNYGRHKGGAENYAVSLAEQLAFKHEVHVYCQTEFNQHPQVQTHVMSVMLTKPRWLNMLLYSAWTFLQTRRGFDIVHSHENVFHGNVQTFHVKPVTHNLFHGKRGLSLWWAWLKAWLSPRLLTYLAVERQRVRSPSKRLLITASQLLKDLYAQTFNLKSSDIHVLTPGVTPVVSSPLGRVQTQVAPHSKASCRQALGLPADQQILLMVGHNYEKKGLGTLLHALTQLSTNHVLAVVGDTHQIPVWRQKAQQLGVDERVFFLGQQTHMDKVYPACDLFVHATLEDVFPIVVLEAMSHGLPVIVSPAPYCLSSNLLTHQHQAWVLNDPHDHLELAKAVETIETQAALRTALLKHAKLFVQQYSWDNLAQAQMRMYFDLLDRTP